MKAARTWIFWLTLTTLSICTVYGEFFVLSGPEYLSKINWLYGNHKSKEMYCLTDESSSALVWNHNLDWKDSSLASLDQVDKSQVLPESNEYVYPTNDGLTCQMSYTSQCTNWKKEGDWKFRTSITRPMAPVTDNRWEDFQTMKLTNRFASLYYLPNSGSLSISVRGASDAHFAICDGTLVTKSYCFFIILGGWKNKKSVIRKCPEGLPEATNEYPTGECALPVATHNGSVLSSTEWKTFTIKWDFESRAMINVYDSNTTILNYESDSSLPTGKNSKGNNGFFIHARSAAQMLVKWHIYTYSVTTTRKSELTSPEVMSTSSGNFICLEMSISLCEKCLMYVDFVDRNGTHKPAATFQNRATKDSYGLPTWQYVKINKTLSINNQPMKQPVRLVIRAFVNNNTKVGDTFWAISNIRRCYHGSLKAVKIKAYQDSETNYFWPNVTCQQLLPDGTTKTIEANELKPTMLRPEFRPLCGKGKIGPTCAANCSILFPDNNGCRKLVSCDQSGCSCAPGYLMPECEKNCPELKYGFECKQDCGNCAQNNCDFTTGECKYGCGNTKNHYFLPPFCKIGVGTPPAPNVELIHSSFARLSLDVKKEYTLIPTNISFEIWTNSTNRVFQSEDIYVQNETMIIESYAEHLIPGTHYKAIAILQSGKRTFKGEWGNFTTSCTESLALNFVTTINETSIKLENLVDVHINDTCPFTWYHVQLLKDEQKLFDNSTPFPKTFDDLDPFTQYRIVIRSDKNKILNKTITTLEGAPDTVTNLKASSVYTNETMITWNPPVKTRGKLVNYTIEIKPIESVGCSSFDKASYNDTTSESLKIKYTVTNVTLNNYRHTFSNLRPYTRYLVIIYAFTIRHQGEKLQLNLITSPTEIPTEVFTDLHLIVSNETSSSIVPMLQWNIPNDCTSITGPIRVSKLVFRRVDSNITSTYFSKEYSFTLEKSVFNGNETYEVYLYALRNADSKENETAYAALNFRMPPRAPPSIEDVEIVETDTINGTVTLRWKTPTPPFHGTLDHYSIIFCKDGPKHCHENQHIIPHTTESCSLWNLNNLHCTTLPLPAQHYNHIYIRAHNLNVTEASNPVELIFNRTEFVPMAPTEIFANRVWKENATISLSWTHPLKSGGKLEKFTIVTKMINSTLKTKPWKEKIDIFEISSSDYQPQYTTQLSLLSSSTFLISVRAVTIGGLTGEKAEFKIVMPAHVYFSDNDLKARTNNDLMIWITIPKIINDVNNSKMVIIVQGPRFCEEGDSNNEDVDLYMDMHSSPYYKAAWKAATLENPENYADKDFQIGDGQVYGGSRNYALCPMESYIIRLALVDNLRAAHSFQRLEAGKNILGAVKTDAILLGEVQKNYVAWITTLCLIVLITILIVFVVLRKKLVKNFVTSDTKTSQHENMPLSSDFNKKKSIDEVESAIKIKETKDLPNNNIIIIDKKKEYFMPVKVEEFGEYFEYAYKGGILEKEYSTIISGAIKACAYGSQSETKPKNRYANLFPYDETRVVLEKLPDDDYSDYINANFITGYGGKEKAYIATQGPKPNTVIDFWRMIWQERVQIICMMTNLEENGKTKCEQYWPSAVGKRILYGTISVQFFSEEIHSDFIYRTFRVTSKSGDESRMVEHLHYTAWPDHGVPSNPRSIVSFLKEIQKHSPVPRDPKDPPIVVHCSAGVGRTGTLIVLDICICRALIEHVIDVFANVLSVRNERLNMVDNTEQYLLVHLVLVEYLNSENTCFVCDKTLSEKIAEAKKNSSKQYQRILDTNWWNEVLGTPPLPDKALSIRNKAKHRFPETAVSAGLNRLYLKRTIITDEDSDYIAATNVKNLIKDRRYITTQLPMPTTSVDFWRMLSEQNVEYVLVLQSPNLQDPTYSELVPENQEFGNTKYLKVLRQESLIPATQYYFVEEVLIINSAEQPSKEQRVQIINYRNWPDSSLPTVDNLIRLWKFMEDLLKDNTNPIVIACRDGLSASGLWLSTSFLLKRMAIDNECDVPQAVQAIRRCRKEFLNRPEYLEFLYDVALVWSAEH